MNEEILIRDIKKYSSFLRMFDDTEKRVSLYQDTANAIRLYLNKNGIQFNYNGTCISLSVHMENELRVVTSKQLGENDGAYELFSDPPTIYMKDNVKYASMMECCKILSHETGHYAQTCISLSKEDADCLVIGKFLNALSSNLIKPENYTLFGVEINDRIYINGQSKTNSLQFNRIIDALYGLSLTERVSNSIRCEYAKNILGQEDYITIKTQEQNIQTLRSRYRIPDSISNDDVMQLLDSASTHLYQRNPPTNYIEAQMMYDLVTTLGFQTKQIKSQDEYVQRMQSDYVSKCLAEIALETNNYNYFSIEIASNNISDLSFIDIDIESLSQSDLLNNPKVILYSLLDNPTKTKNLIPNIELLKQWCYSSQNYFPKEFMDQISEVLGPDFSGKKCEFEKQKEKALAKQQSAQQRINDCARHPDKYQSRFETLTQNNEPIIDRN